MVNMMGKVQYDAIRLRYRVSLESSSPFSNIYRF